MSRVLAVDTATGWGAVALLEGNGAAASGELVAEFALRVRDAHAARLLPLIESALDLAGWDRASLDAYAAVRGPGSFTGIRVGLGLIRGLGLATGKPCYGIGTLDAMAAAAGPVEGDRVPLLEAGRNEVYGARFDPTAFPPAILVPPWVGPASRALRGGSPPVLLGAAAAARAEALRAEGPFGGPRSLPGSVAGAAARIAGWLLATGASDGEGMEPSYVRPSDAEAAAR